MVSINQEFNYKRDWCIKLDGTKEQWDAIVALLSGVGVEFYGTSHDNFWDYLSPTDGERVLRRYKEPHGMEVDVLGAYQLLTRPVKTEQQKRIDELQETLNQVQQQIKQLKKESK